MNKRVLAGVSMAAIIVAACSGGGGTTAPPAAGGSTAPGGGDLQGKVVKLMMGFAAAEATNLEATLKPFEDATGVDIQYNGITPGFEQQINVVVEAGNPPDIALIPQPGLVNKFAAAGKILPLPADIEALFDTNYAPGWKALATAADGKVYGTFHRVNVKAQIFYPKGPFEAKGYTVPTTWDELKALQDKMAADGTPPWCVGMDVGWPGTDWIEAIMLRTVGSAGYDKWISHETKFSDPAVKNAFQIVNEIFTSETLVFGGPTYAVQTKWDVPPKAQFEDPPQCWLTNMGNFVTAAFTDEVNAALDDKVGVFTLPALDSQFGTPALVGGDTTVAFRDAPEVWAVLKYMSGPDSSVAWAKAGGALFPYKNQDVSNYPTKLYQAFAKTLAEAPDVRFDGSDLMPPAVGNKSFWDGMLKLAQGADLDTTLKEIDDSWPAS
jgi:alpha-glucoside transport system substrate-binding protein